MHGLSATMSLFLYVIIFDATPRQRCSARVTAFTAPPPAALAVDGRSTALASRTLRRRRRLDTGANMSANDITPANGLTTAAGDVQNGGLLKGESVLHHNSNLFDPTPSLAGAEWKVATARAGAPHFGDIAGGVEGKGANLLRHFQPLERIVLTANGNLQRVVSSYYDAPVTVEIKRCKEVEPSVYDREVTLSVLGREFCVAKSLVVLHCPTCAEAVQRGSVGIGQLFRALDILPSFELLNAGRKGDDVGQRDVEKLAQDVQAEPGSLWRVYDLRSGHLSCRIHEEFCSDLFDLEPPR